MKNLFSLMRKYLSYQAKNLAKLYNWFLWNSQTFRKKENYRRLKIAVKVRAAWRVIRFSLSVTFSFLFWHTWTKKERLALLLCFAHTWDWNFLFWGDNFQDVDNLVLEVLTCHRLNIMFLCIAIVKLTKKVWRFLIKNQLTKSDQKRTRSEKNPLFIELRYFLLTFTA